MGRMQNDECQSVYDIQSLSGNAHALYDRIGLVVLYQSGTDYYKTMILTDIDLPFGDDEKGEKAKEKIARIVIEQFESYNRRTR